MRTLAKTLAAASALTILGMTGANASILTAGAAGGSEAILTLTNGSNATITQDLGEQIGQITGTDVYTLSAAMQSFIAAAGGLSNVSYAIIAGWSTTRTYLTSSADADLPNSVAIANSERNVWAGTLNNLIPTLNSGDASAAAVNNTYGPLTTGTAGNYLDGGFDLWNGAYVVNTGAGDTDLSLYKVVFGTNALQNAAITSFGSAHLTANQLQIVPVPAAVWLFGSGVGLLGVIRRRIAG